MGLSGKDFAKALQGFKTPETNLKNVLRVSEFLTFYAFFINITN